MTHNEYVDPSIGSADCSGLTDTTLKIGFQMRLSENIQIAFEAYLERWFCHRSELINMAGASEDLYDSLVAAKAIPGDIYRMDETGYVWSALEAYNNQNLSPCTKSYTRSWTTPAVASWLRAAVLTGRNDAISISSIFKEQFAENFSEAIDQLDPSLRPYSDRIGDADTAWEAWSSGAYGVCLKVFAAPIVVNKLTRRLRAKELIERGSASWSREDKQTLLCDITQLSIILTPFSPFERASGTPGTVIDVGLKQLGLGNENPYKDHVRPS